MTVSLTTSYRAFAVVNLNNQCKNRFSAAVPILQNTIYGYSQIFEYLPVPMIFRIWNKTSCSGAFIGNHIRDFHQRENLNYTFTDITVIMIQSDILSRHVDMNVVEPSNFAFVLALPDFQSNALRMHLYVYTDVV